MDSSHKPILIVIAGPNGSGKTTITSRLLKSEWLEDAVYINPDNVAQEKFGDWNSLEAVINAAEKNNSRQVTWKGLSSELKGAVATAAMALFSSNKFQSKIFVYIIYTNYICNQINDYGYTNN